MGNDFCIDESVVCISFSVNGTSETMVRIVHDAYRGDRRTVGCQGREGEDRLMEQMGSPFDGVHRSSAAYCKNHIRLSDFFDFCQCFCIFKSGVVAIKEGACNLDLPFAYFANQRLCCFS